MAAFRKDLQPADQSSAANAYRQAFLYDQNDLTEEVHKLYKGNKDTYDQLREIISYGAIQSVAVGTRPIQPKLQVELAFFGCYILLLTGLFPPSYDREGKFSFILREASLLKALKGKLKEGDRLKLKKGKHLSQAEEDFLKDLEEDDTHPYEAWLMTLVMNVVNFCDAK